MAVRMTLAVCAMGMLLAACGVADKNSARKPVRYGSLTFAKCQK